jgi:RNA polymerase sigma factor (sigma-70 family)
MAISRLRHKKIESKNESNVSYLHELQISRSSTEQQVIDAQQKLTLLDAVNTLPPICRQIFVMRKIEEKSHSEIAEIMNVSPKTVENHLAKGMQLCRKYMMNNAVQQSMNSQTQINKA